MYNQAQKQFSTFGGSTAPPSFSFNSTPSTFSSTTPTFGTNPAPTNTRFSLKK
jgi:hypothetical protein